jgi:low affinity Fe/Cu permease
MGMQVKEEPKAGLPERFSDANTVGSPLGLVCTCVVMIHSRANRQVTPRCETWQVTVACKMLVNVFRMRCAVAARLE